MTKGESALAKALKAEASASLRLHAKVKEARKALGNKCTHPASHVEEYRWEHDNGYGRQSWISGKTCKLCQRVCHYPSLSGCPDQWSKPEWAE